MRKNYLQHIFFRVVRRAKELSKGHKLSNPFIGANNACGESAMRQTMKERLMNLSSGRPSWGECLFFETIKTSGNNWINVKTDESITYREPDLSKRGSHGEGE